MIHHTRLGGFFNCTLPNIIDELRRWRLDYIIARQKLSLGFCPKQGALEVIRVLEAFSGIILRWGQGFPD